MAGSSKSLADAKKGLKKLLLAPRPGPHSTAPDIFHFGVVPQGYFEGQRHRPVEEHRAIAMVTAAVLDQTLQGAILAKLPGLTEANNGEDYIFHAEAAPLRDFDAKIRMALALGIIGEGARADLSLIRQIRNVFAHSRLDINFQTPEIVEACNHFTLSSRKPGFVRADDACETFIDVGWEYAINLIVLEEDQGEHDAHSRSILDLPEPPQSSPEKQP